MADDLLGMLYGSLTPERKLLAAITNNMTDSVRALLERRDSHVLVNTPLQTENGRAALHVASQMNRDAIVARLLAAGADVTAKDLFGLTPVMVALRSRSAACVRLLLEKDARSCAVSLWGKEPPLPWLNLVATAVQAGWEEWMNEMELLEIVVIAMPVFPKDLLLRARKELVRPPDYAALFMLLVRVDYWLCAEIPLSSTFPIPVEVAVICNLKAAVRKSSGCVQSLQHYARLTIRKSVTTNVYHASKQLPLPTSLQNYLFTFDESLSGLLTNADQI